MTSRTIAPAFLASLLSLLAWAPSADAIERVADFGANPGNLAMYKYVPANLPAGPRPLVLAMHGCQESAAEHAVVGWNELADEHGILVVYPEQNTQGAGSNPIRCFNWAGEYGDTANLVRGRGENLSLRNMVGHMAQAHSVDPRRVFASGFSAGGAMVPLLLATWPEVFAAGAVQSGLPFHCATTVNDAFSCMTSGRDRDRGRCPKTRLLCRRIKARWRRLSRTGSSSPSPCRLRGHPIPRSCRWRTIGV